MSVNAGSRVAPEWAGEEIKKLSRLDRAEVEMEERRKNEADNLI